jgi:hypothetical protein
MFVLYSNQNNNPWAYGPGGGMGRAKITAKFGQNLKDFLKIVS